MPITHNGWWPAQACFSSITVGNVNGTPIPGLSQANAVALLWRCDELTISYAAISDTLELGEYSWEADIASGSVDLAASLAMDARDCSAASFGASALIAEDGDYGTFPHYYVYVSASRHVVALVPLGYNGASFYLTEDLIYSASASKLLSAEASPPYDNEGSWRTLQVMVAGGATTYTDATGVSVGSAMDNDDGTLDTTYTLASMSVGGISVPLVIEEQHFVGSAYVSGGGSTVTTLTAPTITGTLTAV